MQRATIPGIDTASLRGAVSAACYAKGLIYARQHAVQESWWEDAQRSLHGTVLGQAGSSYTTTVYFWRDGGPALQFQRGVCSCPVGLDCKHAVALTLDTATATARQASARQVIARQASARQAHSQDRARLAPPDWELSLSSLLESRPAEPGTLAAIPLAIELTLDGGAQASDGSARLWARLMQPGKNGGWISSGLSWGTLDYLHPHHGHPAAQVRVLRELYAVYQSASGLGASYRYYRRDDKAIELSAFESAQLWPLLDEAESAGLRLVYSRKQGTISRYAQAELCLDVTSGAEGALTIVPSLLVDGSPADARPLTFIGPNGHGVVYVPRAEAEGAGAGAYADALPFRLARLSRPVPPQLQRLALADQPLRVPADGVAKFGESYYPKLRRAATVISSDQSFTPPEISAPSLVLGLRYDDGHRVEASWSWAYQVGQASLRIPVPSGSADTGYRDLDAEQAIVAELDPTLERFGLLGADYLSARPVLRPRAEFTGLETMRLTTELVPLLADHPKVLIEVSGQAADYREAGDSLRIGVSTAQVDSDTDWFDLGVTITVEGKQVPFREVFTALSRGTSYLLLDDGAYFSLEKPELRALAALIDEAMMLADAQPDELRISRFQAGLWQELAELGIVTSQAAAWERQVGGLLAAGQLAGDQAARDLAPPATLQAVLRPYQHDGFGWLAFLWEHQLGGILADDMGLGKTLQTLALICLARQAEPDTAPFLVVTPTSVVSNWAAESAKFTPGLKVVTITETFARGGRPLEEIVAGADVIVTSYTLLRIDFAGYGELEWSAAVLDEAQYVKNHQSKIHQCARRLRARSKIAITGTPMENNLMELWALLSITAPGLFPTPQRFKEYYARPIEKQGSAELLAQLRRRIRPLVLRRTKDQVAADLPAKQEQILEVELHPRHRKLYETHLQRERQKVLGLIGDLNSNRFTIFRSLTLLRQLSLHAGLIDPEQGDLPSSKIETLIAQLRDVSAGGHRALVFSQFTGFLTQVRKRLDAEGMPYCYLDGKTRDRAAVLRRFKEGDWPVFLISLKAGGFGLNLTEADYCFLLDPWWNPATEAQAVDRTHRIGQTRNVMVYRLIAKDTIEEKVMALKERKAALFSSVLDEGDVFSSSLTVEDIQGLVA